MAQVANARDDGLSAGVGRVPATTAAVALALGGLALLPGGLAFALATALFLAIWYFALRQLCLRQIGGQTGDVLGALEQGGEIIVLLSACVFLLP
jgi:adenosylcobinamide-GDP ribazoletransferase